MWLDLRQRLPSPFDRQFVLLTDLWDGYPAHRADLMGYLKSQGIRDVVAVSGDLHAFQCGVVRDNPDPALGTPVMVDFVGAGISSESLAAAVQRELAATPLDSVFALPEDVNRVLREQNPDLAYVDFSAQGYAVATVTAGEFSVVFNKVRQLNADGSAPVPALQSSTRIRLAAGTTVPVVESGVI
jgi:alkaline phosphatase D